MGNDFNAVGRRSHQTVEMCFSDIEVEGIRLRVCGELDDPYFGNIQNFAHENRLIPAVLRNLRHDAIVFDVGANIGLTAAMTAAALPEALITAVEPSYRARTCLERTAAIGDFTDRLTIIPACMGATIGSVNFHEAATLSASHISVEGNSSIPMVTLDAVFAEARLPRIDFVKIDVEGWETDVIAGGGAALLEGAPIIVAEMNTWQLNWARDMSVRSALMSIKSTFGIAAWVEDNQLRVAESEAEFRELAWAIEKARNLDIATSHDHRKVRSLPI